MFYQAEDGIRYLVRSRGLGDVYKRQGIDTLYIQSNLSWAISNDVDWLIISADSGKGDSVCLLYTSDAADERSSVDLGGRRIIKKKNT